MTVLSRLVAILVSALVLAAASVSAAPGRAPATTVLEKASAPTVPAAASVANAQELLAPAADGDLAAAPQVQRTATFTFATAFTSSTSRVALSDVATCAGDHRLCDEAYGIDLGPAPEPGRMVPLESAKLMPLLTQEWPDAELRLAGATRTRVTALASQVQDETLVRQLQDALSNLFAADGTFAVTVERLAPAQPVKVRPGELTVTFPDLTPEHAADLSWVRKNLVGQKRLAAVLQTQGDGGETGDSSGKAAIFNVRFGLKERLPVLTRDLNTGAVVNGADVIVGLVDVCRTSQRCVTNAQELIGRRLKHPVSANEAVPLAATEVDLVIKRGQLVHMVMEAGGIEVSTVLQAQSNAAIGDTLTALYPTTKKKLHVRAVDSQTVEYVR